MSLSVWVRTLLGMKNSTAESLRHLCQFRQTKAVEIGTGVENAGLFGSKVHDEIVYENESFKRTTNRAGGLEGGITNGEELRVRGFLKPISTFKKPLRSVDIDTKKEDSCRI